MQEFSLLRLNQDHTIVNNAIKALQQSIKDGKWDTYLPSERLLASQFNIGRGTLRKVLAKLSQDKWIDEGHSGKRHCILDVPTISSSTALLGLGGLALILRRRK